MGVETARCAKAFVKVGAMPTPLNIGRFRGSDYVQTYHLFIWYNDGARDIIYRGGPDRNSTYDAAVQDRRATKYSAATTEAFELDWPFGNLITNRMVGLPGNYDYAQWVRNGSQARHMVTIAEGSQYCELDAAFTAAIRRVGYLGRTYNAVAADRTDNSNATAYTVLKEMGLPMMKPDVYAPGWGTDLFTTATSRDKLQRRIEEFKEPFRRFDRMNPMEQADFMRRLFGG